MCIAFWQLTSGSSLAGSKEKSSAPLSPNQPKFVLAFNRDEFLDRPTKLAHYWEFSPAVLAPLDLMPPREEDRGTWLGVSRDGRIAVLTNYRELNGPQPNMLSRGRLVRHFLESARDSAFADVDAYAQHVLADRDRYAGFNLLLFDVLKDCAVYVTNRGPSGGTTDSTAATDDSQSPELQSPGYSRKLALNRVYGISNSTLDVEWPKVKKGKALVEQVLGNAASLKTMDNDELSNRLFEILSNRNTDNGVDCPKKLRDLEHFICIPRISSSNPTFSINSDYATRTAHVIIVNSDGKTNIYERSLYPENEEDIGPASGDDGSAVRKLELTIPGLA
ncbi:hypothetical protein H4219_005988 [Mycoemilia scoparia]|uniref:Uncharacterized protein n=1 Tax=Mycoemilia scoparia TaxID=417184 RepID=A0A9W8DNW7_9FUNG|nr:hypothetical protein H4219_005988 [Mycoemilia scoparia]